MQRFENVELEKCLRRNSKADPETDRSILKEQDQ